MDVKALKSEIVGHLDEMQRTIQQAKRVAYFKVLYTIGMELCDGCFMHRPTDFFISPNRN